MKRALFLFIFTMYLIGCAGSSQSVKSDRGVGGIVRFSFGVVSLGLLLSGHGSSAQIPSALLGTALNFGKAVDSVVDECQR